MKGPKPLAPGTDLDGNRVSYPPQNMLDDDLATAYRIQGDASGATITFTLPRESVISEVGMVNGYAKKDSTNGRTVDWYLGHEDWWRPLLDRDGVGRRLGTGG